MSNRTYGQVCPMARALDILGDRWTLLLIRELLLGPKRFTDLLALLPTMGTNRLSGRLTMLVDNRIIRPTSLPEPLAAPAYELTELGEQLRQPMIALGLWGLNLPLDERIDPAGARAELLVLCLTGASDPTASAGLRAVVGFQVGAETFHVQINDGQVLARSGAPAEPADIRVRCDIHTFMALALHQLTPTRALRERRASLLRGTPRDLALVFKVLEYRP